MKVCHFYTSGGLRRGHTCIVLVNALAPDIEVALIAPRGAGLTEIMDKRVAAFEYGSRNTRANHFPHWELYRLCKKINPNIVHTNFAKASEIFSFLNKTLGIRHVASKHNPRKGRINNKLEHVIAVSKGVADSVRHANVKTIYTGINPVQLPDDRRKIGEHTILAVGRLEKIKAFDTLIMECSKLDFDFLLFIVGEGSERAQLEKLTKDLKLEDKVRFLGFRYDVPDANVVVQCSHSEGCSLVLLEAMFYSNMVVSRKVGIAPEVFPDILLIEDFNIAEKLQEVHEQHDKFARSFDEMKRTYVPMFSMEHVANEHIEYYKRLLG